MFVEKPNSGFFICIVLLYAANPTSGIALNEISSAGMKVDGSGLVGFESFLKKAWKKGDNEAGGHLVFAWALGLEVDQDLKNAILHSNSLAASGATRAYTTLALLQNHNLTEELTPEDERSGKAMDNYAVAAVQGDPLAQLIVSNHYAVKGDCVAAIGHSRKAASSAIENLLEMEIARQDFVNYILDEDNPIPVQFLPSTEKLHYLEHMALRGEAELAVQAAVIHLGGSPGIPKDLSRAEEMLRIAVDGNNTYAMVWLGQLYLRGMVTMEGKEAFQLLQKALDYGNGLAYSGLGRFYSEGKGGFTKNVHLAEQYFKKGMEAGNVDAFYQLGKLYASSEFNDTAGAADLWKLPASIGHLHSAWRLAENYSQQQKKVSHSSNILPNSAEGSSEISTLYCELALPLYNIVGLSGEWKDIFETAYTDFNEGKKTSALLKYLLLSDLGYNAAHVNAARILQEGDVDIYSDSEEARMNQLLRMWSRAAKGGISSGFRHIGDHHFFGWGTNKNLSLAVDNYKIAFHKGDAEGAFNYALSLEWGQGAPQNLSRAREIFNGTLNLDTYAQAPIFLAVARLELYDYLNQSFGLDFHDKQTTEIIWSHLPDWDLVAMTILSFTIAYILYIRRQL